MNENEFFEELSEPVAAQRGPVSCHHYVADDEDLPRRAISDHK